MSGTADSHSVLISKAFFAWPVMAPFLVCDYSDVDLLFTPHQGCSPACAVVWEEGEYGFVFISLSHLADLACLFLPGKYPF